jgi:hypothetical protein
LETILPRGGQRGTEVAVEIYGQWLGDPFSVVFHQPGITVSDIAQVDENKITAKFHIAPDCAVGTKAMRIVTGRGITNPRLFSVGNLVELQEKEPNNDEASPQVIAVNSTVNGVVTNEDVDYYAVTLEQGAKLAVEAEAMRLGLALFDIKLRLFGPHGHELVAEDDTAMARQDAAFVYVAEEAGRHVIAVSETSYSGAGNYYYRLHAGNFPRPMSMTPLGGPPNADESVTWLGDPRIGAQLIHTPAATLGTGLLMTSLETGIAPTPMSFRYSNVSDVLEVEPNNAIEQATPGAAPGAFDGVIGEKGDTDWFKFAGTKDQVWDIRVWARELGSPLDSVMNITSPSGSTFAGDDDARGADSYFRVTLPEDGEYKIWIADHLKRGGAAFAYRIEVTPIAPALTINDAMDKEVKIAAPQGGRTLFLLRVARDNFGGDLRLRFDNLPQGVTVEHLPLDANTSVLPVLFNAAPDAPQAGALVDAVAEFGDVASPLVGRMDQNITLVEGPNLTVFWAERVDRLAMAVTKPAPLDIRVVQPSVPIVQNGYMRLKIVATRAEGFDAAATIRIPYLPTGFGAGTATIEQGKNEVDLQLEAAGNAPIGPLQVAVIAEYDAYRIAAPFVTVDVQAPWVTFQVANVQADQGKTVEAKVALTQVKPYEGTFKLEMGALPRGVTTQLMDFVKDTTELIFPIVVAADAPECKQSGMYMSATLMVNGEPIVHRSGGAELTVFKPLPPAVAPAAPAAEQPAAEAQPAHKSRFPGS